MNNKKCYIAGPISRLPEEVYRANFAAARIAAEELGFVSVCPVSLPHHHDKSWLSHMREDLTALLTCDAIYAMRGWKESKGATIEVNLALSLGLELIDQEEIDETFSEKYKVTLSPEKEKTVLERLSKIV